MFQLEVLLAGLAGQEGGVSSGGGCVYADRLLTHQPLFECLIHEQGYNRTGSRA